MGMRIPLATRAGMQTGAGLDGKNRKGSEQMEGKHTRDSHGLPAKNLMGRAVAGGNVCAPG